MATVGRGRLPAVWAQVRTRFIAMPPRARWINLGLLVLLVVAIVATVLVVTDPGTEEPIARTATVRRGDVTALVTGSGNAESSLSTPVSFPTAGTVTSVSVEPGDSVTLGQVLATVDDAAVQAQLRTAQAQLDSAEAALAQAESGPTEVQGQQDQLAITQAQQAVDNARAAVTAAQKQLELDRASTQTAIDNAKTQLENDKEASATAVENAEEKLETDTKSQNTLVKQAEADEKAACGASSSDSDSDSDEGILGGADSGSTDSDSSSTSCTSAKLATQNAKNTRASVLQADEQAITVAKQTRESTVDAAEQAITTAEQTRADTLLSSETAIETTTQAVTTAEGELAGAKLTAEANLHPQTPEQIAQAQATVDSAQVDLDSARLAVEQTQLKAPQAGVVLAVGGKVGEFTGGSGSDGSSDSDADSDSAASDSATSAGDGFIVIANLSELAVTAEIPEADAAKLELGQRAEITFPGTDTTTTGSVTRITPQSTVSNDVVFYPVAISLDTAPPDVGVGATAELSVTTGTANDVLVAPTQAVTSNGDRHTVTVRRGGTDVVVPVDVGVSGPTDTDITRGVAEGDVLVLPSPAAPTTGSGAGFPKTGGR
jgi:multidrug efflux pump subunit AcrA (membrane-fusion protein)